MKRAAPATPHGRGIGQKRLSRAFNIAPIDASVFGSRFNSKFGSGGGDDDVSGGCCQKGDIFTNNKSVFEKPLPKPIYKDDGKDVAEELSKMKFNEREDMISDIHGVVTLPVETDELLERKLRELQQHIDLTQRKLAYNQAQFLEPASVRDRELRLMMLRTDLYDAKLAAQRLINFFELKLELFGLDLLTKPIRFEDLSPGMVEELYHCRTRIGSKDQSGRPVVFTRIEFHEKNWRHHFGSIFYLFMNALKGDIETQRKGFVTVVWDEKKAKPSSPFFSVMAKASKFFQSVPIKFSCYHYCCPHIGFANAPISFMRRTVGKIAGFRVRSHNGTYMECAYQLMGYGIKLSMFPVGVNLSGQLDYELWAIELNNMRQKERENQDNSTPKRLLPTSRDCLLGRGFPYQHYIGNLYLAALIEHNRSKHMKMNRKRKTAMSTAVVQCIKQKHGGRFLRKTKSDDPSTEDEIWVEVSDKDAREKVGHGFRSPERSDLLRPQDIIDTFTFGGEEVSYLRPFPVVMDADTA